MRVRVETHTEHGREEMPSRFYFDERCIKVAENVDCWCGSDYSYFKVLGDDGNVYILHLDEKRNEWDMTLFQRGDAVDLRLPGKEAKPGSTV